MKTKPQRQRAIFNGIFGFLAISDEVAERLRSDAMSTDGPEPIVRISDREPCAILERLGALENGQTVFVAEFISNRQSRDALAVFAQAPPSWGLPIDRIVFGERVEIVLADSAPSELGLEIGRAVYCVGAPGAPLLPVV